jgi:ATP/maltotriose-dependent transcriptional regulator MalT/DNA-binding SARP family transcriptional activator
LSRLPAHHIRRPRLSSQCLDAAVVVVEAGAGYGKTVFGAELVDAWRAVAIEVVLHEGGVPAQLFAARLRAAVAHAGFSETAAAMAGAGEDAAGAVDALLDALAGEPCAFVVDDAHHAERDAGVLIERLAEQLQADQRLVVLARQLPAGTARLRRADCVQLSAADLALRPDETLQLCRAGFGLDVGPVEVAALERATGGWTAATALAAARARRTGEDVGALAAAAGGPGRPSSAVAAILDEALATLPPAERRLLAQVGRLPLLDAPVVDVATGIEGYFGRALAAGIPFTPGQDGWWDLPGPVRDHLASLGVPAPAVLRRAAGEYGRRGQLSAALQLLLASGDPAAAAGLLSDGEPASIEALDALEIQAVVDRLPAEAVEAHPNLLLHFARSCETAGMVDLRTEVLSRVTDLGTKNGDSRLARAIEIERASDLIRDGSYPRAETAARRILDAAETGESLTRARAFSALGRTACRHLDSGGRQDPVALQDAERHFAHAARLYDQLGMRGARAGLVPYQAMWIEYARGESRSALKHLQEALSLVVDRPRKWAYLMVFHAEVSAELACYDQCEADIREVFRVGEDLRDELLIAYGHWQLAISASHRRDAAETLERIRLVEAHKANWWAVASADFLADAADCLDRVGHSALAVEYLSRAQDNPQDGEPLIVMAEAALLARHGDPDLAEEKLLAAPGHRIDLREYWRVTLLRAYAAFRRGNQNAGALAARAFEEAARLGLPHLPLTREGMIAEELLGLAVETGQPAALALEAAALPVCISVLGRFALTRGGRPVPMTSGQAAQLLKMVAVSGGRVRADAAIEVLWPEADPESGRNRLRTVLNRQRAEAGEVLVRAGDLLLLAPEVRLDLELFGAEARRALALGLAEPSLAVALARAAIARYRGDVLPDDRHEEWAELPREHARRTMLQLLDLCADAAAERGDLDETRRVIEMTIDLAPYDDERYLRAATALLQQGRRGAALAVVRRARAALAELGLQPPVHLISLEEAIVA